MLSPYLLLVFLLVPVMVLVARRFYITDQSRMTSQTVGWVARTDQRVVIDPNLRRTETEVVVRYSVDGHEMEIKRLLPGERASQFPVDRKITVRYNPTEPNMADFSVR